MLDNPAVLRALDQTFHSTAIDHAEPLPAGLSSDLIYRITVKGSPYILRIMTRIDERMDPARIFACMRAASGAGIAPPLRYSSPEDGITIIDFIDPVPFPASRALAELPAILRKLHALPPFPKTFNYVTAHNGIIWRFRESNLLPVPEIEEVFTHYGRLCAAYPRLDADMVSCHSDLKPENILHDGRRAWLTGWQAAFVNDRYFDLALAANFLVRTEADELTFLAHYFDEQPSEYQRARLFLMRQVVHMLSATVFLTLFSGGKPVTRLANLPSFEDFHRQLWSNELELADNSLKIANGLIHWNRLLENMRQSRFEDSLALVRKANPALLLPQHSLRP